MSHNLLDDTADLGSEEEDEDFDEGASRRKPEGANGAAQDSSDEEEDDDDEEEAAKIREGFIVDEDEDDDDEDREARKREKRKRRRAEREEEEAALDDEDLELIGEPERKQPKPKWKRLKRGHRDEHTPSAPRGVEEMFSDDDEEMVDDVDRRRPGRPLDEFADFIEEDEFDDDIERALEEEREVARPGARTFTSAVGAQDAGLDEVSAEDMRAAFGDGNEYDWALAMEAEQAFQERGEKHIELKDVFEPSELKDRMLTDEDNEIRARDIPERFQLARKPFKERDPTSEEMTTILKEETLWITNMILPKKSLDSTLHEPFKQAVRKVLEFMNVEDYEPPFIFQHRKDYLIHADELQQDPDGRPDAKRLLLQNDLWEIFDLDLKFRGILEKREALQTTYEGLQKIANIHDDVFETMVTEAVSMDEIQDVQDYLHFHYSAPIKDLTLVQAETNGTQKRAQSAKSVFERVRSSPVYEFVRGLGIRSDQFAANLAEPGLPRTYTEDSTKDPIQVADDSLHAPEYSTSEAVMKAGKAMFVEELVMNPRMRKYIRGNFYETGFLDCVRTEKGLRQISEDHPYYPFKYLRQQDIPTMVRSPDLYLRMLKAEAEGLVEVKFRLANTQPLQEKFCSNIESDNVSEVADAWNATRREVVTTALARLERVISKGVKETLKSECENYLARACRERFGEKLDQAPYKPKGMVLGTIPRVLALSNGRGVPGRDAICWAYMEEDGRVLENGKFVDLRLGNPDKYLPDGKDVSNLVELVQRRKPDVIALAGFTVETKKLHGDLLQIVDKHNLECNEYEDNDGRDRTDKLEVIIVNDEVARLYHNSERSAIEYPGFPPITRYCIALAKYLQSPLKEYASIGKDIVTIPFDPNQDLVPKDKLQKHLESAMVDMVNLVGVDINDAITDQYTANLLPYVCGLGPRKTSQLIKAVNANGGVLNSRYELLGDFDESSGGKKLLAAVGAKVFANCASFLYIDFEPTEVESDYLDNTRVHPEDYDIGRKMAADALELDEEDIKQEVDDNGPSAIIRRLIRDKEEDKVNELVLEEYAVQLEQKFHQRKRATLETIRAELISPYEELRRNFALLSSDDIFIMLTGDTKDTLAEGMIIPVIIRRTFADHIEVKLDNGVEGAVSDTEYPETLVDQNLEARQYFQVNQTVQAKVLYIDRKRFSAQLSLRGDALKRPYRKDIDRSPPQWDEVQEARDRKNAQKEREDTSGRAQRVVNHPLFFSYTAVQAEEYLGSKEPGAVVIRPSSKGPNHLAVTWKIADNVYQHIDVLELNKENEFSLGKTLRVGSKYTYSDLDELIVNHVESMAKKVTEIMKDERYQKGSRAQAEQWLKTYTEANPKRSMYAFCIDPQYPGYFKICFKAGLNANIGSWPIKVIPNAYEMQRNPYPDMKALKNGFKRLFQGNQGQPPRR